MIRIVSIEDIADGATSFLLKVKAVTFVYNQGVLYRPKEPKLDTIIKRA